MFIIATVKDYLLYQNDIPLEIRQRIKLEAEQLDMNYGERRHVMTSDGGFIICILSPDDLIKLSAYIDVINSVPESVEVIEDYVRVDYLKNNDYLISVYMHKEMALTFVEPDDFN